ncbi:magnesium transporter CorA family protein [Asticcacaulis sp. 201]|uniref:magnesium transporter CorA family protein n=1 Tax=Asticcacaulis sp. 201 TaxID=3028787 RepID=UPI002915F220|nr:CorA family divalent cation transporter [Asticcacaulis sp. 201]MDV6331167.1 CorA family divalent cation transporter [Asticcacaulis sp. 201]
MTSIRTFLYNAEGHDEEIELTSRPRRIGKNQLLWVDGSGVDLEGFKHLPPDMRAALAEDRGTRNLEIFDTFYRFVMPCPYRSKGRNSASLVFIVGKSWLLTVSETRPKFMDRFVETDRGETLNGRLTPSAFAVALVAELLEVYREEVARIETEIDKLDSAIFTSNEKQTLLETLAKLRGQVSRLRKSLAEAANTIHALTRPDFFAHIEASDRAYFEGLGRILERLQDSVSNARETVIGSFDLYTTRVAQDTNKLVKALTIVTVITGIVGATAGIFGMNFDTPFFHSGISGFSYVTGVMVGSAVAIVIVAIWRRWF